MNYVYVYAHIEHTSHPKLNVNCCNCDYVVFHCARIINA